MEKPFEDNKIFILVSDILVWYDSDRKIKKEEPKEANEEGEPAGEEPAENKEENAEGSE